MSYADLDILKATTCTLGSSHRARTEHGCFRLVPHSFTITLTTSCGNPRTPLISHHIPSFEYVYYPLMTLICEAIRT
jgi:hypothetical protein